MYYPCFLGADINQRDNYGRTPLHVAAAVDYPDMVKYLVERGASIHAKTTDELQTPVHFAARNDAVGSLKMLLKCGANMEDLDYKRRTPLQVIKALYKTTISRRTCFSVIAFAIFTWISYRDRSCVFFALVLDAYSVLFAASGCSRAGPIRNCEVLGENRGWRRSIGWQRDDGAGPDDQQNASRGESTLGLLLMFACCWRTIILLAVIIRWHCQHHHHRRRHLHHHHNRHRHHHQYHHHHHHRRRCHQHKYHRHHHQNPHHHRHYHYYRHRHKYYHLHYHDDHHHINNIFFLMRH